MSAARLLVSSLIALLSVLPAVRAACELQCDAGGARATAPSDECAQHNPPGDSAPYHRGCGHIHGWPAGELTSAVIQSSISDPVVVVIPTALVMNANSQLAGRNVEGAARGAPSERQITLPIRI